MLKAYSLEALFKKPPSLALCSEEGERGALSRVLCERAVAGTLLFVSVTVRGTQEKLSSPIILSMIPSPCFLARSPSWQTSGPLGTNIRRQSLARRAIEVLVMAVSLTQMGTYPARDLQQEMAAGRALVTLCLPCPSTAAVVLPEQEEEQELQATDALPCPSLAPCLP